MSPKTTPSGETALSKEAAGGPLIIAVPSKGRLQENTAAFFARAGLPLVQAGGARGYRATVAGLADAEIAYLSASEIAREIAAGGVHLGITGLDLVHETIAEPGARDRLVHLVVPLGFGYADVVVAVPRAWLDVRGMADLADVAADFRARHGRRLRVATKYVHLTRAHFAAHGIVDYAIVESAGATEGAPAAGSAELIVDITTTGSTLHANGLRILDDGLILRSEANLVSSKVAQWSPGLRAIEREVVARLAG
jgi:ATP phosphoribosyltransferase